MEIRDLRIKEKFSINDEYLNGYARLCGVYATAVYNSLCRHADKNQECFPSIKLISEQHAISERAVIRAIKKLLEWSIIKKTRERKNNGKWENNIYQLLDKSQWKSKPSDSQSVGSQVTHSPQPSDSQSPIQVTHSHTKDTHIKDTHIRITDKSVLPILETSPSKEVMDYYYNLVLNTFGFKPEIRAKDGKLLKTALEKHGADKIKKIIYWYLGQDKADKLGIDLSICLSGYTINQYHQNENK